MKQKKYPVNPVAKLLPYNERLKRYHQDKDRMFSENINLPADKLNEEHERIMAWWDI